MFCQCDKPSPQPFREGLDVCGPLGSHVLLCGTCGKGVVLTTAEFSTWQAAVAHG